MDRRKTATEIVILLAVSRAGDENGVDLDRKRIEVEPAAAAPNLK